MYTRLNLLRPMTEQIDIYGDPVRGSGWYGLTTGVHCVSISVQNFTGRVSIQASLTAAPTATDWFTVMPGNVQYIQYPQPGYVIQQPATGQTSTYEFTFTANAVWVRAVITRSYFLSPYSSPKYIGTFGLVEYAMLSYGNNLGEFEYRRGWEVNPQPR